MIDKKIPPEEIVKRHDLSKSKIDIEEAVIKVLENNQPAVSDYRAGEEKALNFLVGIVMRDTLGKVDANTIRKKRLDLI